MNTKQQGLMGVGRAISFYTMLGYTVSIPIDDSQDYDLVIDDDGLKKVQVKTTGSKRDGVFVATLKTCGGNRSRQKIKSFDSSKIDLLFILTTDGDVYNIPTKDISLTSSISLGSKYEQYKSL